MRLIILIFIILFYYSCKSIVDINNEKTIGIRQYKNDSLHEAVNTLSKVISITDTCADCFLYRGFAFKDLKQYDEAIKDFSSLTKIDKEEAVGYSNMASVYYLQNNYKSALIDFTKAYKLDTTAKILLNPISHMLFATG